MKKFAFAVLLIGSYGAYVFSTQHAVPTQAPVTPTSDGVAQLPPTVQPLPTTPTPAPTPTPTSTPVPAPAPVSTPKGLYIDGSYTGTNEDAYYGNVQVKAIIRNGKIADVVFLDHPQDRGQSIEINNMAMPLLRAQAIKVQSANVDGVSGATETSYAFMRSLAAALISAKN